MPKYRFVKRPKSNLFSHLEKYRFILVTGPHRAGTTIAAAMVANDLGYGFEEDWQDQLSRLAELSPILGPIVIHCPSYCHFIHHLAEIPDLAAVMVIRDVEAIIASQKRIPWAFEPTQLNAYRFRTTPRPTFAIQPPIATVKYRYWQEVQRPIFGEDGYEVHYDDLESHPMWVSPEQRKGFTSNQLEVGKPHGPKVQGIRFPVGIAGNVIKNQEEKYD
jgi:hypothetical protein